MNVKPKKHFGQHFLKDQSICEKIAKSMMAMIVLMLLIVPAMLVVMVVISQDHVDTMAVLDEGINGCSCWATL